MKRTFPFLILAAALVVSHPLAYSQVTDEAPATRQEEPVAQTRVVEERQEGFEDGDGSFLGDIVESAENRFGFTFAAYSTYTPRPVQTSFAEPTTRFSNFTAGVFTNFPGRRGTLGLNYSFGYRTTNGVNRSSPTHSGSIRYNRTLSRNVTFSLADTVSSGLNEYGYGYDNPISAVTQALPVFAQEVFVERQRIIRNYISANLDYKLSQKANLSLSATHATLWYELATREAQGLQATLGGSYEINRWMTFGTHYSNYFSKGSSGQRDSMIHRLQLADFGFDLPGNIRVSSSGGVEYTHQGGNGMATTGVRAGWSHSSRTNSISVNYHRGFSSALGPGVILVSHDATVAFNQSITSRINAHIGASATKGSSAFGASLQNVSSGGGFEFLLATNLVAVVNGGYAFQKSANLGFNAADISRYTATVGVTYAIPVARGR